MNNPLLAIQVSGASAPISEEAQVAESVLGSERLPFAKSKFKEHGRITPEGFVAAGDFLAFKFPVWQWEKGDSSRAREFLPADKQYLITRNVPCLRRATAVNYTDADEDAEKLMSFLDEAEEAPGPDSKAKGGDDEDWVATHIGRAAAPTDQTMTDIPDISDSPPLAAKSDDAAESMGKLNIDDKGDKINEEEIPDMDDIPDMDEAAGLEEEGDDAAVRIVHPSAADVHSTVGQNLLQVRTYDCLISYDKHYQTPRFWLFGYDENKTPLTPTQVFQDVPSDYAFKTMTMEPFPHSGAQLASVHPCKHASVMKKFIDRMEAAQPPSSPGPGTGASESSSSGEKGGKKKWGLGGMVRRVTGSGPSAGAAGEKEVRKEGSESSAEEASGLQVDFYLVIFLKFIASIVPTIEVDSTTATML